MTWTVQYFLSHVHAMCVSTSQEHAIFVKLKLGELCLAVGYRKLNRQTTKDAYSLPLPDEIQNQLSAAAFFTFLDLQCGYQSVQRIEQTYFLPRPWHGTIPILLYVIQSNRSSEYVSEDDEFLVHPATTKQHRYCLHVQVDPVSTWSWTDTKGQENGISEYLLPDEQEIKAIQEWPTPTTVKVVRRFLGLASRYIQYTYPSLLYWSNWVFPWFEV